MARPDSNPEWPTALPRVSLVRRGLFRLAMVAVVTFFTAAAIIPFPGEGRARPPWAMSSCDYVGLGLPTHAVTPANLQIPRLSACDTSWSIGLRIALAGTGILIAWMLVFMGARLDRIVLRRREHRLA